MATYSYEIITKTPIRRNPSDAQREAARAANKNATNELAQSTFGSSYTDSSSVSFVRDGFYETSTTITSPVQAPAASLPPEISSIPSDPNPLTTAPVPNNSQLSTITEAPPIPRNLIDVVSVDVTTPPPTVATTEPGAATTYYENDGTATSDQVATTEPGAATTYYENDGTATSDQVENSSPAAVPPSQSGYSGQPYDDADPPNLYPGWTLNEDGEPVYVGGDFVEPATAESAANSRNAAASRQAAQKLTAQQQQTLMTRQNTQSSADWRVRLSLAPGSTYLYNAAADGANPDILAPLRSTQGVIFPYTPSIEMSYQAKYSNTDLIHSNYKGYFYQNSSVSEIQVRGTFTAQDTKEAQYLLAVIHFFRSVTKMFYGKDQEAGVPPPLVFLSGYGQYQFNNHPCVVGSFTYSLPTDVDYIRAEGFNNIGLNLENRNSRSSGPAPSGALATIGRLFNSGLFNSSLPNTPSPSAVNQNVFNTNPTNSTYVPTKMDISISLLPMQTRSQQSQQFSLKGFANGDLLKGGFW